MAQFTPNLSNGPCLYCKTCSIDYQPEELLRCDLCRRSAHFVCLRLQTSSGRLLGDNFFCFTCRHCSHSDYDKLARVDLKVLHLLLLVLYNLHKTTSPSKDGYYHWKMQVFQYLEKNWTNIFGTNCQRSKRKLGKSSISGQMSHYPQYFERKDGSRRSGGWYRMMKVLPPAQLLALHYNEKKGVTTEVVGVSLKRKRLPEDDSLTVSSFVDKCRGSNDILGPKRIKLLSEESNTNSRLMQTCPSTSSNSSISDDSMPNIKSKIDLSDLDPSSSLGENSPRESFEDSNSRSSWFFDRENLQPDWKIPIAILEEDDQESNNDLQQEPSDQRLLKDFSDDNKEEEIDVGEDDVVTPLKISLFNNKRKKKMEEDCKDDIIEISCEVPMTLYEERQKLRTLDRRLIENGLLPPHLYRLRRKLALRQYQRQQGMAVFNLDTEISFIRSCGHAMTRKDKAKISIELDRYGGSGPSCILDRFHVSEHQQVQRSDNCNISFKAKLIGTAQEDLPLIFSPYTLRKLKPYIFRDYSVKPLKLKLLEEIVAYPHRKDNNWKPPPRYSIDYCYVLPKHIPVINNLARTFFWPGIELSEILEYPDFTCIVQYRGLVIGFGVIIPDSGFNESYISFLFVHPEWRRAGIAKFILYHLIQTCMDKDITLHVSAANNVLTLYQKFGFKVEEFLHNFYDKYFPVDSPECKHAMYMRLNR